MFALKCKCFPSPKNEGLCFR